MGLLAFSPPGHDGMADDSLAVQLRTGGEKERYRKEIMVTLKLYGESTTTRIEIVEFSMLEPSAWHCRFKTAGGEIKEAHGLPIDAEGAIDSLPPCISPPSSS